jgi:hypothetical protein
MNMTCKLIVIELWKRGLDTGGAQSSPRTCFSFRQLRSQHFSNCWLHPSFAAIVILIENVKKKKKVAISRYNTSTKTKTLHYLKLGKRNSKLNQTK